mmetsp:Transcript_19392/g.48879  ORF Transcript_19392/g.48879 Transcript_19392/m.48879 type:complete len:216 (-) Transcript_19392:831-1478(-)
MGQLVRLDAYHRRHLDPGLWCLPSLRLHVRRRFRGRPRHRRRPEGELRRSRLPRVRRRRGDLRNDRHPHGQRRRRLLGQLGNRHQPAGGAEGRRHRRRQGEHLQAAGCRQGREARRRRHAGRQPPVGRVVGPCGGGRLQGAGHFAGGVGRWQGQAGLLQVLRPRRAARSVRGGQPPVGRCADHARGRHGVHRAAPRLHRLLHLLRLRRAALPVAD